MTKRVVFKNPPPKKQAFEMGKELKKIHGYNNW